MQKKFKENKEKIIIITLLFIFTFAFYYKYFNKNIDIKEYKKVEVNNKISKAEKDKVIESGIGYKNFILTGKNGNQITLVKKDKKVEKSIGEINESCNNGLKLIQNVSYIFDYRGNQITFIDPIVEFNNYQKKSFYNIVDGDKLIKEKKPLLSLATKITNKTISETKKKEFIIEYNCGNLKTKYIIIKGKISQYGERYYFEEIKIVDFSKKKNIKNVVDKIQLLKKEEERLIIKLKELYNEKNIEELKNIYKEKGLYYNANKNIYENLRKLKDQYKGKRDEIEKEIEKIL